MTSMTDPARSSLAPAGLSGRPYTCAVTFLEQKELRTPAGKVRKTELRAVWASSGDQSKESEW